jgi:hypothetical protein
MNNEKQPSPANTARTTSGFPEGSSNTAGKYTVIDNRSNTLESVGINSFHNPYQAMNDEHRLLRLERAYGLAPDAPTEPQAEEISEPESPTVETREKFDMKHKHHIERFGRGALRAARISFGVIKETGPEDLTKFAGIKTKEAATVAVEKTTEAALQAAAKVAETAAAAAEKIRLNHLRFKKYVNVIKRAQHVNSLDIKDVASKSALSTKKYVQANSSGALKRAKHVKSLQDNQ